jgi:hypothetical protein
MSTSINGPIIASFPARPVLVPIARHCLLEMAQSMIRRASFSRKSRPKAPYRSLPIGGRTDPLTCTSAT